MLRRPKGKNGARILLFVRVRANERKINKKKKVQQDSFFREKREKKAGFEIIKIRGT